MFDMLNQPRGVVAADQELDPSSDPPYYHALSLWEPWAMLVALDEKRIETRDWGTDYRGWIAIQATKNTPADALALCNHEPFVTVLAKHGIVAPQPLLTGETQRAGKTSPLPQGAIVAFFRLLHVVSAGDHNRRATLRGYGAQHEAAFGNFAGGRKLWISDKIVRVDPPIPSKGGRGLWHWYPTDAERERVRALIGG